jgi:hypothetical protein
MPYQQQQQAFLKEYLDYLHTHTQILSEEGTLITTAIYAAHERRMEIQRGERLRKISRITGSLETQEEAIREITLYIQRLEDEKAWIETQEDELNEHMSMWSALANAS